MYLDFERTARGTPQQNVKAERKFVILFGYTQSFLNEAGTAVPAGQGIILGHTRISGTASTPLSVEQLHRWRVREIWNEGARFAYESDGTNVWFWGSDNPGASTWVVGDRWIRAAPAAAGVTGGRCTAGGTPGTWNYESSLAA